MSMLLLDFDVWDDGLLSVLQDVVMMCQAIEKLFEQKILAMPKEVRVVFPPGGSPIHIQ